MGIISVGRSIYEDKIIILQRKNVSSSLLCDIHFHQPNDEVDHIKKEWNTKSKPH
jgi:hypothetical protein